MKNKAEKIIGLVLVLVIVLVSIDIFKPSSAKIAGAQTDNFQFQSGVSSAALCGNNTATLLLGTSTGGRSFISIGNASSRDIFLSFGASSTNYTGFYLKASSTMQLGDPNVIYGGAITCSALGGTATATVQTIP